MRSLLAENNLLQNKNVFREQESLLKILTFMYIIVVGDFLWEDYHVEFEILLVILLSCDKGGQHSKIFNIILALFASCPAVWWAFCFVEWIDCLIYPPIIHLIKMTSLRSVMILCRWLAKSFDLTRFDRLRGADLVRVIALAYQTFQILFEHNQIKPLDLRWTRRRPLHYYSALFRSKTTHSSQPARN